MTTEQEEFEFRRRFETESAAPSMTLGRAAGLTGRGLAQGAASLLTMPVDLGMAIGSRAMGLVGKMAGLDTENGNYTNAGEALGKGLTAAGLPEPKTAGERLYSDVVGAVGGVAGGNALAKLAMRFAPAAGSTGIMANQAIERALTQNVPQQYIGAIGAAQTGGMARELGAPAWVQLPAAMIGGMTSQAAAGGLKKLYNTVGDKVGDVTAAVKASKGDVSSIDRLAQDAIREATKNQRDDIVAAMQSGGTEYVKGVRPSVTERIAGRNLASGNVVGSEVAALQAGLENYGPTRDIFASARKGNIAAMAAPLERIAGGSTIGEIDDAIKNQAVKRDALTGNLRETALNESNIANRLNQKMREAAIEGRPQQVNVFRNQLQEYEKMGLRKISDAPIMGAIVKTLNTEGQRGQLNTTIMQGVAEELQRLKAAGGGQLMARDLAAFRREGINDVIGKLLPNADDATKRNAARIVIQLKPAIDKAIVDAGGKDWPRYLSRYSKMRDYEDQMAASGAILQRLRTETGKENVPQLMRALGPGEEQFSKRITKGATALTDIFTPNQMKTVIAPLEKEVQRMTAAMEMKKGVTGAVTPGQVAGSDMPQLPQFINAKITITNAILRQLGKDANTPVAKRVAQILANEPETFAKMVANRSNDPASVMARDWLQKATVGSAILMGQQQGRETPEAQR